MGTRIGLDASFARLERWLVGWQSMPRLQKHRSSGLVLYVCALAGAFAQPLTSLTSYAAVNELNSHTPAIPLVVLYLLYKGRSRDVVPYETSLGPALAAGSVASVALGAALLLRGLSPNDELTLEIISFVGFIIAGGFLFLGWKAMKAVIFPVSFLIFMIPLPERLTNWIEMALVQASADAAAVLFRVTGTPLVREGTVFGLPGIVLEVARECSGIRSTLVLFITSLLFAYSLLDNRWRRAALVLFVVPLGIVRNAFRILVIGLLCVHVGPYMIDSPIHHQGGPLFFVLSLVPLALFLVGLRRGERSPVGQ